MSLKNEKGSNRESSRTAKKCLVASEPPKSVSSQFSCLVSAAIFIAVFIALKISNITLANEQLFLFLIGTLIGLLMFFELVFERVFLRRSTGLVFSSKQFISHLSFNRSVYKLFGLAATLAVVAGFYSFASYYDRSHYTFFWYLLEILFTTKTGYGGAFSIPLISLIVLYFVIIDALMVSPKDGYWQVAMLFSFQWKKLDTNLLREHALAWLIKAFFLALMVPSLLNAMIGFRHFSFDKYSNLFVAQTYLVSNAVLVIDLAFVVVGYTFSARILDSHIRNSNPYVFGWLFTLMLYVPFWPLFRNLYFSYGDGQYWFHWLDQHEIFIYVWGTLIILTKLGWAWSNIIFGFRFSNLTHRGIITNGPYRYTKHPSYLFKNISWWLLSVPFISSSGPLVAFKHCLALFAVNLLYFIRARAEEKHLSADPVYTEYAYWINRYGIFRRISVLISTQLGQIRLK